MTKRYHYTGCGLDWVYLVNGFKTHETPHGSGVSIDDADGLHEVIARDIILQSSRMRGQELRFIRSMLKLSQDGLAKVLGVTRPTIARWEGEREEPIDQPADRLLRVFYAGRIKGDKTVARILELLTQIDDLEYRDTTFAERGGKWRVAEAA